MDAVTEVLLDRSSDVQKLSRMVMVSLLVHGTLLTAIAVVPRLLPSQAAPPPEHVIDIAVSGPEGPIQGRNAMAGKEIQQAVPDVAKPKNDAPPALIKPEMVESVKTAKPEPKAIPKPEPKTEVPQLHGRTPTQGTEVKAGAARVDTNGAAKPFAGLATGGGMDSAYTDISDFCCPEYLMTLKRLIYSNWNQRQGQEGSNVIKFVIHRDGSITDVSVDQSANPFLNLASQRALAQTHSLPPLPAAYPNDRLTVFLAFQYKR
jgi:TonB family protein